MFWSEVSKDIVWKVSECVLKVGVTASYLHCETA